MKGLQKTPPSRASCDFRWVKRAGWSHIQGRVGGHSECCWVKNVLHSLSFICGSNEAILVFLTRDFKTQTLCDTVLFGTVTDPFISKQDDRSIQMNNQNRWRETLKGTRVKRVLRFLKFYTNNENWTSRIGRRRLFASSKYSNELSANLYF